MSTDKMYSILVCLFKDRDRKKRVVWKESANCIVIKDFGSNVCPYTKFFAFDAAKTRIHGEFSVLVW